MVLQIGALLYVFDRFIFNRLNTVATPDCQWGTETQRFALEVRYYSFVVQKYNSSGKELQVFRVELTILEDGVVK